MYMRGGGGVFSCSLENSSCAYGGADFPIYTAPMRGSCVTSAVLISAVRAILGTRACISFMLPVVLFCYRVCLFGTVPRWVQVRIRQCFILQWWGLVGYGFRVCNCGYFLVVVSLPRHSLVYVDVGTCSAVSWVLCATGAFVPRLVVGRQ
jgi:hypothetical protein